MVSQRRVKVRKVRAGDRRGRNTEPQERPEIRADVWARWFKEDS